MSLKPYVPHKTLQDVYKTLIQPHFDYCSPLWDNCGLGLQDKLQKFQNRAARVITGADYDVRSSEVLNSLGWEKLANGRALNKLVFIYKTTLHQTLKIYFLEEMYHRIAMNCVIVKLISR